jgi:NAD(P)-dependent dehydrogenase (short-subunit alcohol dehydrogenase family)
MTTNHAGKLEGKVAIVTGATIGMGRAIAERFAAEGAAVICAGRDAARGADAVSAIRKAGGRAEFVAADIGKAEPNQLLVDRAIEVFGGVDILVPNAGVLGIGSITEVSVETWHETIATNLHAVFYLCRAGIPAMKKRGSGAIVVNGSIAAMRSFPNHPAYCASKGALVPLVKQIALDYGPEIRINLMCPGPVDTPLLWDSARAFPDPAIAVHAAGQGTALKRLGLPSDIASLALFLASDDSAWITGAAFTIDGGALCR